jgi:pyrroloquinoline quinone biosynthesis protein E
VELAGRLEFRSMVFSLDINDFAIESWAERNTAISVGTDFDIDQAWRMVERGKELGVKVGFWAMASMFSTQSPERLCPWPFERSYVGSDSRVVVCCMIANPDIHEIGHGPAHSLTERWRSDGYAAFRQAHLDGRIPEICQGCYELPSS